MDTFIVILVLIVLFVLLGAAAWLFGKEAATNNVAWMGGTRQIRSMFAQISAQDRPFHAQQSAMVVDSPALLQLTEELRSELMRTSSLGDEIGARLQAVEAEIVQTRDMPQAFDSRLQVLETDNRQRIASLRRELSRSHKAESTYTQRRNDAVRDLYQKLAQVDVALGAVINPMLLPGERVSVPDTLADDTLVWDNWGDVADRAYAFGEAFSKQRVVLDPGFADRVEQFITTFREALTGTVYPTVQSKEVSQAQKAQMRNSVAQVVDEITPLRREFEHMWLSNTMIDVFDDDYGLDG